MNTLAQTEFITQTSGRIAQDFPWVEVYLLPTNRNRDASDLVLVCAKIEYARKPWVGEAYYCYRRKEWQDPKRGSKVAGTVTHWAEKPAPPREYGLRELDGPEVEQLVGRVDT